MAITMVALAEEMRLLRGPFAEIAGWMGALKSSEGARSAEEPARNEVPPLDSSEPPAPNNDSSIPPEPDDEDSGSSGPTLQ
jgi:hypothetical protein